MIDKLTSYFSRVGYMFTIEHPGALQIALAPTALLVLGLLLYCNSRNTFGRAPRNSWVKALYMSILLLLPPLLWSAGFARSLWDVCPKRGRLILLIPMMLISVGLAFVLFGTLAMGGSIAGTVFSHYAPMANLRSLCFAWPTLCFLIGLGLSETRYARHARAGLAVTAFLIHLVLSNIFYSCWRLNAYTHAKSEIVTLSESEIGELKGIRLVNLDWPYEREGSTYGSYTFKMNSKDESILGMAQWRLSGTKLHLDTSLIEEGGKIPRHSASTIHTPN